MNIWCDLMDKYPNVAFNYMGGKFSQSQKPKCKHLYSIEPYTIAPANWHPRVINEYDTWITWNEKFITEKGLEPRMIVMQGGCLTDNISPILNTFIPYDKKIKGILILGKRGHNVRPGNIYHMREDITKSPEINSHFVTHIYAHNSWGGSHYQGHLPGSPWDIEGLQKTNEYLFCFCPENTYHSLWSWGYLCEKVFRCFKAKTVGIYMGCFNVDDYIPKGLFIDLRKFYKCGKIWHDELAEYLIKFPKEKYIEMTEKAFEWEKTRTIGRIEHFENILKNLA